MSYRFVAALLAGSLAAACSTYETRTVVVPANEDSCTIYGYTPGTEAYRLCAERETAYRRAGRMSRADFTQARVVAASQDACLSYGLRPGSDRYERCVQREVAYRTPG